jgi:hypothetical protein
MIMINPGDIYTYTRTVYTIGGKSYNSGDKLKILGPTDEAPYGLRSKRGNFNVQCKHYLNGSVWSSIWYAIEMGWLIKSGE